MIIRIWKWILQISLYAVDDSFGPVVACINVHDTWGTTVSKISPVLNLRGLLLTAAAAQEFVEKYDRTVSKMTEQDIGYWYDRARAMEEEGYKFPAIQALREIEYTNIQTCTRDDMDVQ